MSSLKATSPLFSLPSDSPYKVGVNGCIVNPNVVVVATTVLGIAALSRNLQEPVKKVLFFPQITWPS